MMEYDISKILISFSIIIIGFVLILGLNKLFSKKLKLTEISRAIIFLVISLLFKIIVILNNFQLNINIINSFIILLFSYGAIKLVDCSIKNVYLKKSNIEIPKLIHDIILMLIYSTIFFIVLKKNMGIDLTAIATTSAVLSMVIGLALQETLGNFIAGISIHIEKPFKLGDWVLVDEIEGKVVGINWRTTKLLTFDNSFLIIPNGKIIKDSILNFNYPTSNNILRIYVGVSYEVSPDKVKKAIYEVISKMSRNNLKKMVPEVYLIKYNDFSIDYEIRIWIDEYVQKKRIEDEFLSNLWYSFKREDIKIPFPIREVYHHKETDVNEEEDINKRKISLIKKIEFFKELTEEVIEELAFNSKLKKYGSKEVLFEKGDKGDSIFLIETGKIRLEINENEKIIIGKWEFFGEMALFTGKSRTAKAVIEEEAEVLILDKKGFSEILLKNDKMLQKIGEIVAKREKENEKFKKNVKEDEIMVKESETKIIQKIKKFFGILN